MIYILLSVSNDIIRDAWCIYKNDISDNVRNFTSAVS